MTGARQRAAAAWARVVRWSAAAWQRWSAWPAGRQVVAGTLAAVLVLVAALGFGLLYSVRHPPAEVAATGSAAPSASVPATPPDELLREAAAALRASTTAHVTGSIGGPSAAVRVDLSVTDGGDAVGSVVTGGVPVDVIRLGGSTYLRSRALVERIVGSVAASFVGDSWVLLDADRLAGTGIPEALREGTSLDGIASLVEAGESTARLGETRVDEGIGVTEVVSVVGVVDVAAAGTPYPVQVSAGGVADLHLNGFDAPVDVRPPTGNVVDLGSLPGLG